MFPDINWRGKRSTIDQRNWSGHCVQVYNRYNIYRKDLHFQYSRENTHWTPVDHWYSNWYYFYPSADIDEQRWSCTTRRKIDAACHVRRCASELSVHRTHLIIDSYWIWISMRVLLASRKDRFDSLRSPSRCTLNMISKLVTALLPHMDVGHCR